MRQWFWKATATGFILVSPTAQADVPFAKAQAFLKKNDSCYFAVGFSNPNGPKSAAPDVAEDVFCVTDGSIGAGTINEKSGCSLMLLNMNNGKLRKGTFSAMMNPQTVDLAMVEGTKCGQGGFEKLLETKFQSVYGEGPKVKKVLFGGPQGLGARTSVLFSASDAARKSYEAAVASLAVEAKAVETKAAEAKAAKDTAQIEREKKRLSSIVGVWNGACEGKGGFGDRATYDIRADKTFSLYLDQYKSEECSSEKKYQRITISGTYSEESSPAGKSTIKPLDFTAKSVRFVIYDSGYAAEQSEQSKFGLMSIVTDKEYDVSSSKEFGPIIGKKSYGLYQMKDGKLFFNKSTGGIINPDPNRSKLQIDSAASFERGSND